MLRALLIGSLKLAARLLLAIDVIGFIRDILDDISGEFDTEFVQKARAKCDQRRASPALLGACLPGQGLLGGQSTARGTRAHMGAMES